MFLNLLNIVIGHAYEDDTMFTLHNHEPACVILTLPGFFILLLQSGFCSLYHIHNGIFHHITMIFSY